MPEILDTLIQEKQLAKKETQRLRRAFKKSIKQSVNVTSSGEAKKATVRSRFKRGRLDRLIFVAPDYIFKQHYGFEGTKKNGVAMRLKSTNVLNKAIDGSNVLETLADGIADIRAEQVMFQINFNNTNGR